MFSPFLSLSTSTLENLSSSLYGGVLAKDLTVHSIEQIAGKSAPEIYQCLIKLKNSGMSHIHISYLISAIGAKAKLVSQPSDLFDLVISGPSAAGIPTRDTAATILSMVETAEEEIVLVGYVVYNMRVLFSRIAQKMAEKPGLKTKIFINIPRLPNDTSLANEIVNRFTCNFIQKHWPFDILPELYYDVRSLELNQEQRSSLHAKCVIVDRKSALVTSANFTNAAHERNIEVGLEIKHSETANKICQYLEGLIENGILSGIKI